MGNHSDTYLTQSFLSLCIPYYIWVSKLSTIETKWAALELMLGTSNSVVALAKKMAKPETKTVTRTVAVPKTKIVTQQPQQQSAPKDTERTDFTAIRPQPPLPNQQDDRDKR